MSKNRHSYVPFYASDWIAGTSRMTPMQELVYFRICCYIWDKAEPCPVAELPLLLGAVDAWGDLLEQLIAAGKLDRTPDGSLQNTRALSIARTALELWRKKSTGGKRGAEKTNKGDTSVGTHDATPAKSPDGTWPGVPSQNQNQNQNQNQKDSVPDGTGAAAPPDPPPKAIDPAKPCYDIGKPLLAKYGLSAHKAGGLITKWLKEYPPDQVLNVLQHAGTMERADIVAFVTGCLRDPFALPDFLKRGNDETNQTGPEGRSGRVARAVAAIEGPGRQDVAGAGGNADPALPAVSGE